MGTALDYIHNFFEKYLTIPEIYPSDIFEIIIISVLCYYVILWFRKSRAWTLLKGIFMIVIFMVITTIFHLTTLQWIINKSNSRLLFQVYPLLAFHLYFLFQVCVELWNF